jgi:uncharacterized protein (TIGR00297 family)
MSLSSPASETHVCKHHAISKKNTSQHLLLRLAGGLALSGSIGLLAYRRGSLSRSGIFGAIFTGTTTVGLGGGSWGFTLIYFFLSSSFLSHFRAREKEKTAADKFSKGSQRDFAQVIANGGVASACAISNSLISRSAVREIITSGYAGALATATADTWATELGVLSTNTPRLLTTGKTVPPGTSGGITPLGICAAATGALSLGTIFKLLRRGTTPLLPLLTLLGGLGGSLFDSWLGATFQAMYICPTCQQETEQRIHNCGTVTQHIHGVSWMNNDVVNFLATLFGGLCTALLQLLLVRQPKIDTHSLHKNP